jgi:hypothetical protein
LKQTAAALAVPPDDFIPVWQSTFSDRVTGIFKDNFACLEHVCHQHGIFVPGYKIKLASNILFNYEHQAVMSLREEAAEVGTPHNASSPKFCRNQKGLFSLLNIEGILSRGQKIWRASFPKSIYYP